MPPLKLDITLIAVRKHEIPKIISIFNKKTCNAKRRSSYKYHFEPTSDTAFLKRSKLRQFDLTFEK